LQHRAADPVGKRRGRPASRCRPASFAGGRTTNGEIYDDKAFTAAPAVTGKSQDLDGARDPA
jgi:hypothetical protein